MVVQTQGVIALLARVERSTQAQVALVVDDVLRAKGLGGFSAAQLNHIARRRRLPTLAQACVFEELFGIQARLWLLPADEKEKQ